MQTIKNPLRLTSVGRDTWHCDSSPNTYRITRKNDQYYCTCPARVECRHIKQLKLLQDIQLESQRPLMQTTLDPDIKIAKTKGFRRSILEIQEDFCNPIPDRFIRSKVKKGQTIKFVSWYSYIKLLNYFAPGFDWEVRTKQVGDRTVVEGRLTIRALEGDFVREATGTEDNDIDACGDPSSNAEAMALRRCCAKFGLGLDLWIK